MSFIPHVSLQLKVFLRQRPPSGFGKDASYHERRDLSTRGYIRLTVPKERTREADDFADNVLREGESGCQKTNNVGNNSGY